MSDMIIKVLVVVFFATAIIFELILLNTLEAINKISNKLDDILKKIEKMGSE